MVISVKNLALLGTSKLMKFTEGLGSIDHLTEHTYTAANTLALREIQLATKAFLRNCSAPASLSWNFPCIHPCTFRERFSQQRGLKKLHFYSWPQLKLCSRTYTHTHTERHTQLPACRPLLPLALSVWIQSWEPNPRWFSEKILPGLFFPLCPRLSSGKT